MASSSTSSPPLQQNEQGEVRLGARKRGRGEEDGGAETTVMATSAPAKRPKLLPTGTDGDVDTTADADDHQSHPETNNVPKGWASLSKELRDAVYAECDHNTIKQLRLVDRAIESEASFFLFTVLTIGFRKRYTRRLERITTKPKFAKGVRKVVFETLQYKAEVVNDVNYYNEERIGEVLYRLNGLAVNANANDRVDWASLTDAEKGPWKQSGTAGLARVRALQRDEAYFLTPAGLDKFMEQLGSAFTSFKSLRHVVMSGWSAARDREFLDHGSLTGANRLMPPPLFAGVDLDAAWDLQAQAGAALTWALRESGRRIEHFEMLSTPQSIFLPLTIDNTLPPMMPYFKELARSKLARLKTLELDLSSVARADKSMQSFVWLSRTAKQDMPSLWPRLGRLETLCLRFGMRQPVTSGLLITTIIPLSEIFGTHKFAQLRELTLDGFWLEPEDLCNFLTAHSSTLENISLKKINLGATKEPHPFPSLPDIVRISSPYEYPTNFFEEPKEWEAVVKSLQALPKLRGLRIENASMRAKLETMGLTATWRLVEAAMNGRPNGLDDGLGQLLHGGSTWLKGQNTMRDTVGSVEEESEDDADSDEADD